MSNMVQALTPAVDNSNIEVIDIGQFIQKTIPPRKNLLAPWLPEKGLCMVYAPRGVGKTFFALNVAYAVASGGEFIKWNAPEPVPILYLDGEMPAITMQERMTAIIDSHLKEAEPENFKFILNDFQIMGMPDLSDPLGQLQLEPYIDKAKLIIVDNISTICRSGKENESESWNTVQEWALRMRAQGRSVLFVHHAGKGGAQRGTSKREDILDTVIALRHPSDYDPSQGATFEVHFEKSRGFYGDEAESIECSLTTLDDKQSWAHSSVTQTTYKRVVDLLSDGLSQTDIARELNINKSSVSRHAKKAKECGDYKPAGGK